jgi:hypothetical protein
VHTCNLKFRKSTKVDNVECGRVFAKLPCHKFIMEADLLISVPVEKFRVYSCVCKLSLVCKYINTLITN